MGKIDDSMRNNMGGNMDNNESLLNEFKKLGVPDPESWARSQLTEGIDQLSRAKVLSMLTSGMTDFENRVMIRSDTKIYPEVDADNGYIGTIMKHMLESGVTENEIIHFIRRIQLDFISHITSYCDGYIQELPFGDIRLSIHDDGEVKVPECLAESVLSMDESEFSTPSEVIDDLRNAGYLG